MLLAAGRPASALTAWMIGRRWRPRRRASPQQLPAPVDIGRWARSPARARQAAAAQVIGAQARLYARRRRRGSRARAARPGRRVLDRAARGADPELDAVNALTRFGSSLPASAVDPILTLLEPRLASGDALTSATADLLITLYQAVPGRRGDLGGVIGQQLALPGCPENLWEAAATLPAQARGPRRARSIGPGRCRRPPRPAHPGQMGPADRGGPARRPAGMRAPAPGTARGTAHVPGRSPPSSTTRSLLLLALARAEHPHQRGPPGPAPRRRPWRDRGNMAHPHRGTGSSLPRATGHDQAAPAAHPSEPGGQPRPGAACATPAQLPGRLGNPTRRR